MNQKWQVFEMAIMEVHLVGHQSRSVKFQSIETGTEAENSNFS